MVNNKHNNTINNNKKRKDERMKTKKEIKRKIRNILIMKKISEVFPLLPIPTDYILGLEDALKWVLKEEKEVRKWVEKEK